MAVMGAVGCAHRRPIPVELQRGYFECPGVTIDKATAGLVGEGWLIAAKGEGFVQTDWRSALDGDQAFLASALIGASYKVRLSVRTSSAGVEFTPFLGRKIQTSAISAAESEGAIRQIDEAHLRDEQTRAMLNGFRRTVCGGPEYFQAPPPKKRRP